MISVADRDKIPDMDSDTDKVDGNVPWRIECAIQWNAPFVLHPIYPSYLEGGLDMPVGSSPDQVANTFMRLIKHNKVVADYSSSSRKKEKATDTVGRGGGGGVFEGGGGPAGGGGGGGAKNPPPPPKKKTPKQSQLSPYMYIYIYIFIYIYIISLYWLSVS